MEQIIDFTNDKRILRRLGGSDRKFEVEHDGIPYLLKFQEKQSTKTDITTSYPNNVTSEYIGSHIAETIGLPVHQTVIGTFKDDIVVGCKDFRAQNEENMEFQEFVHAIYDSKDIKRVIRLDQIYETLNDQTVFPQELKTKSIERYWDTFVVDSLIGNFDRHIGNWGYIINNSTNKMRLAPIYDFGSSLLPKLSDDGIDEIINDKFQMYKRCLIFPSPALYVTSEKTGKIGYYDMLASNYDPNCSQAVKRIVPNIDINKINDVIDNTPLLTSKRKDFYKQYIGLRKNLIIDRAYAHCISMDYDIEALNRIKNGIQYSEDHLKAFMNHEKQITIDRSLTVEQDLAGIGINIANSPDLHSFDEFTP